MIMEGKKTKIKLCGLTRFCDIEVVNDLRPEYIGFVFAPKSRRFVSPEQAAALKQALSPEILAVGVFVDGQMEQIAALLSAGIIDIAQLHGGEDEAYIGRLGACTENRLSKPFALTARRIFTGRRRVRRTMCFWTLGAAARGRLLTGNCSQR